MQLGNHAFKGFDTALTQLITQLQQMGELVTSQIRLLKDGLTSADKIIHTESKMLDHQMNDKETETDRLVADILAKYSPAGEELRFVLDAVKVASSMELLADHMKNCSKRLARVPHPLDTAIHGFLNEGIDALQEMVPIGLGQVAEYHADRTEKLLQSGAKVQQAYRQTLLSLPHVSLTAESSQHIVLVAKNLDQASDKMVDVLKIAYFIHKGTRYGAT